MSRLIRFALALACGFVFRTAAVLAQEAEPASESIPWNQAARESAEALRLEGHVGDGERAFVVCSHCHLPDGSGRADGRIPRLAGQHRSVLIKQLIDIRDGRRENPLMDPFARTIVDAQKLADVTAYLEALPIPRDNGRGPGSKLDVAAPLYERDCRSCHGVDGEGDASLFTPVLAGQHYEYILRQLRDIAAGDRKNIHPDMLAVVGSYSSEQLAAIADYVSRLEWPERQQN